MLDFAVGERVGGGRALGWCLALPNQLGARPPSRRLIGAATMSIRLVRAENRDVAHSVSVYQLSHYADGLFGVCRRSGYAVVKTVTPLVVPLRYSAH